MIHIGLNAHLLSGKAGYRSAGIHGYIYHTLAHLHEVAPAGWQFTAMVSRNYTASFKGITTQRSRTSTETPLRRIIWEQGAQPLQLNDFDLYHAMAFVSPLILNKPSVVTVYDLSFIHYPQVLSTTRRLYLRLFTALSCNRAKRVIAISQSTAQDLSQSLGIPEQKIDVAVPGYDVDTYRPLDSKAIQTFRDQKGLPKRFWLFVGTLEPRKNLPMLLRAYAGLEPNERLPLVLGGGKGWDYDAIYQTIEQFNLSEYVILPGYIPVDELALWYNSAEVFVYPSVFEGFGLPVLEAMACGIPVIVSNVSSLPEVAGASGLCLPPTDTQSWTEALRMAYHNANWRQTAASNGLVEAKRFSWQETAHRTVASYQLALNQT